MSAEDDERRSAGEKMAEDGEGAGSPRDRPVPAEPLEDPGDPPLPSGEATGPADRGSAPPGRETGPADRGSAPPSREGESRRQRRASSVPEDEDEGRRQRRRLEHLLRESFRRAVEKGVEAGIGAIGTGVDALGKSVEVSRDTVKQASSQLRGVVDDVKLPKEAANYLFGQIDETKNVLIRAVSREVRDFLASTDLASELQRVLTSLSFEIRTEIRFVPNERGAVKAEVKSRAVPHRSRREDPGDEGA